MLAVADIARRQSEQLVVAFGGVGHGYGGIKGEFHQSLAKLGSSAVFVRDEACRWYQYGPDELQPIVDTIHAVRAEVGARRLVCLGNSMGGFGALLFGAWLGADAILSIVPQTAIEPEVTEALGDTRYWSYQKDIPAYPHGDLLKEAPATGRVVMCWGVNHPLDCVHAERLVGAWDVETITVDCDDHGVAWELRERGQLLPLIEEVLGG